MKKGIFWLFIFLVIQTTIIAPVNAEWNYTFIPKVSMGLEYDSNIYWSASNKESDFNYQADIAFPFHAVSPDTDIGLNYRTSRFQYSSFPGANYGNHYVTLNASHKLSQRLSLSLSDNFASMKDSDRFLRAGASETESDIIVEQVRNKSNSVTGSMSYSVSPKAFISLSATHSLFRYSLPAYYDSSGNGGTISYNYSLDAQNTVFTSISANNTNYERSDLELRQSAVYRPIGPDFYELLFNSEFDRSINKSAYIGWSHQFSSTLNTSLYIGTRRTEDVTKILSLVPGGGIEVPHSLPEGSLVQAAIASSYIYAIAHTGMPIVFPGVTIEPISDDSQKSSGLIYNLTINKTFESSSLSLSFDQDTYQRSAYGGTSIRRSYSANYNHRLSDRLSAFLNGRYDQNKNESDFLQDKYDTLRVGAGTRYSITRDLSGSLSWNHTIQKRDLQGAVAGPRIERDLVALIFTYQWPLKR